MPTAGVAFSNENLRSLALSGLAATGSTKCMWLSLFACFVEIFPFMLCEPWLRCWHEEHFLLSFLPFYKLICEPLSEQNNFYRL